MNKDQAINAFWSSFGWDAWEETSVPDDATLPYITHEGAVDSFGTELAQTASLWDRSTSWFSVIEKRTQIENRITRGGTLITYDDGAVWLRMGDPWAQRMADGTDDMIRRIVLNYTLEFID